MAGVTDGAAPGVRPDLIGLESWSKHLLYGVSLIEKRVPLFWGRLWGRLWGRHKNVWRIVLPILIVATLAVRPCWAVTPLKTDVPSAPGPELQVSLTLAQDALADCAARGYAASVSVVDSAGLVKVTLRSDAQGKPPIAAPRKAATAVAFDQAGTVMEARAKTDPVFAAQLAAHPDLYNDHPGSVPLHRGGVLIGGLAIADVPHDIADACVRAALAKSHLN